jgi:hypothetical protein
LPDNPKTTIGIFFIATTFISWDEALVL